METLEILKNIFNSNNEFIKSKNFYFETHLCTYDNTSKKVNFEYTIEQTSSNKSIVFGFCDDCKKMFYNVD